MNATIVKFGYPNTLVAAREHWVVLLRPAAVTLGSLVLASTSDATAYGDLPPEAYAEQGRVVGEIERALAAFMQYEKINYLMLMMVDPHVHFHVIPRSADARTFQGAAYPDAGWPGVPDIGSAVPLDQPAIAAMIAALRAHGLRQARNKPVPAQV